MVDGEPKRNKLLKRNQKTVFQAVFLTSSYSKGLVGERNKSEVGAGKKRRWIQLGWRERKRALPTGSGHGTGVCGPTHRDRVDGMWSRLPVARELLPG